MTLLLFVALGEHTSTFQTILIPLIALIFGSGGVAAWFLIRPQSGVLIGQSAKAITEAAMELVAPLRAELIEERKLNSELRERLTRVEKELEVVHTLERDRDRLAVRVKQLETVMTEAGMTLPPELNFPYHEETEVARAGERRAVDRPHPGPERRLRRTRRDAQ